MNTPGPSPALPIDRPLGGPFRGFGTVFVWGLRQAFTGKRIWGAVLVAGALGALVGAASGEGSPDKLEALWTSIDELLLKFVGPVIALLLVAQGFATERRGGTLLYHLVRPVPRHVVYLARFASGWVVGIVTAAAVVVGVALASNLGVPFDIWLKIFGVMACIVTALGGLYYALSSLLRRGLIAGLVYTFIIEVLLSTMPGMIQKSAINFHARSMYHGWCDEWFAANSATVALTIVKEAAQPVVLGPLGPIPLDPPLSAMCVLIGIAVASLLFGVWRIRERDFPLKD